MLVKRETADIYFKASFDIPKYYLSLNILCDFFFLRKGGKFTVRYLGIPYTLVEFASVYSCP